MHAAVASNLPALTPAIQPTTKVYANLEYSATVPTKEGTSDLRFRSPQALEYQNEMGSWRPTLDRAGQVGIQYLPKGTSFEDAVTAARAMSSQAVRYKSFDQDVEGGFLRFHDSGTRPVAVLQARDGGFQLAPMGSFRDRREVSAVFPITLEATFRYDANPTFRDKFRGKEARYSDAADAKLEVVRFDDALKAVVGEGAWADVRSTERAPFVPFAG